MVLIGCILIAVSVTCIANGTSPEITTVHMVLITGNFILVVINVFLARKMKRLKETKRMLTSLDNHDWQGDAEFIQGRRKKGQNAKKS